MPAASPLREYAVWSEPRGPAFEALLNYCASMAGHCCLVDKFPRSKNGRDARARFFESAKPHLIGVDDVDRWPGSGLLKGTVPLWNYRLEAGLLGLLLSRSKGLYDFQAPRLPEDMAVYRPDGSLLLGSVAHEHMAWMNLTADEKEDRRLGLVELRFTGSPKA